MVSFEALEESYLYPTLISTDREQPVVNIKETRNITRTPKSTKNRSANKRAKLTKEPRVCFVTAQFLTNPMKADRLMNPFARPDLYTSSKFKFLAFTNHPEFRPRGWTVMLRNYTSYRRDITKSRWPKFQGFKDPTIRSNCDVVFYFDGQCEVIGSKSDFWNVSQEILQSDIGLAQMLHPKGGDVESEFKRILMDSKDILSNVKKSFAWLHSQDDYRQNIPIYQNKYFAYNPHSSKFQKVANFFWNHYSLEEDSWRDQPLWAYSLHHFNVTPLLLSNTKLIRDKWKHRGINGHRYDEAADGLSTTSQTSSFNVTDMELCFIHIGMTGGDRVRTQFANGKSKIYNPPKLPTLRLWKEFHTNQLGMLRSSSVKHCNYIVAWVRDPVERSVAAYKDFFQESSQNSSKTLLGNLRKLRNKLKGYGDLGSLAEKLYDRRGNAKNSKQVNGAQRVFSAIPHIKYSTAWYFWSDEKERPLVPVPGPFQPPPTAWSWLTHPNFLSRLVFVGANECYEEEERRFAMMFGVNSSSLEHHDANSTESAPRELSPAAYKNLKRFLHEDYEVLRTLKSYGLLHCDKLIKKLG
ncbi:hypothetical protein IV203_024607 [Nitzschia inconspicua]|uniref:Uncharacterized protein n=1 Tax=Nitzschia inconspicua TaxID=303405 RepID=A0A9K3P869_9STRA|nr:hypothetical protein IV203_024607 [Nitzschia inconspicua]